MKASTQRTASSVKVGDYASIHFSDKNANSKRKLSSTSPSLSCAFDSFLRNQTNKHTHFLSLPSEAAFFLPKLQGFDALDSPITIDFAARTHIRRWLSLSESLPSSLVQVLLGQFLQKKGACRMSLIFSQVLSRLL